MKGDSLSSSSWIPRSTPATVRHQQTLPDSQIHLNSSSSQAPDPSSQHSNSRGSFVPHTIANSFRSVFQRNPHRAPSAASLHSSVKPFLPKYDLESLVHRTIRFVEFSDFFSQANGVECEILLRLKVSHSSGQLDSSKPALAAGEITSS